jgi:hypothetical protein
MATKSVAQKLQIKRYTPISQGSVDEVWSALRFRPLAEGETSTPGR